MHRYTIRPAARVGIVNCLVLLLLSTLLIATLLDLEPVLAHVFLSDKNASLLAIANQLKTELELVSYNLDHSDNNLAIKHLADATEIQTRNNNISSFSIPYLDELRQLIESMSAADSDQTESLLRINETINNASRFLNDKIVSDIDARDLKNSTIQALNIANITDEILREYAIAYDIEPVIATTGSMGYMMNMSTMGSSIDSPPASMNMEDNRIPSASRIANISNYQNAQGLAIKALEIFREDLKPLELPHTTRSFLTANIRTSSVPELESGLSLLIDSINDKKPFNDIMQIIHGPVHTNLFLAYDLKMIAE
ncbi:MAG: hypothetical protein ACR2IS_04890 [Nitrososphaeraceae archaeon]